MVCCDQRSMKRAVALPPSPEKQRRPLGIGLVEIERDGEGIGDDRLAVADHRNGFRNAALDSGHLEKARRHAGDVEPPMGERHRRLPAMRAEWTGGIASDKFIEHNGHWRRLSGSLVRRLCPKRDFVGGEKR